ncbi:MAG TPA: FHA domain-containing protein [Drouetiella sp.]
MPSAEVTNDSAAQAKKNEKDRHDQKPGDGAVKTADRSADSKGDEASARLSSESFTSQKEGSSTKSDNKALWRQYSKNLSEAGLLPEVSLLQPGAPNREVLKGGVRVDEARDNTTPAQDKPATRTLDDKTLEAAAKQLHDSLNKKSGVWIFEHNNPDKDAVFRTLEPLGQADRARLEQIYNEKYAHGQDGTLRSDLSQRLGGNDSLDFRKAESDLNRVDGRTNDAGALMVAITDAKNDQTKGNAEIRAVLETLNSKQLAQLDEDFKKSYGMSYTEALSHANLTDATKDSLPILEKGVDHKTKEDVVNLANIAVQRGDRMLFGEALRGDTDAAKQARQELMKDEQFKNKLADAFPNDAYAQGYVDKSAPFEQKVDRVALDYLQEGRISLATIADENTGKWIFNNEENVSLAAKNASDSERAQYTHGRDLASRDPASLNTQEKADLDYYNKIHKAFTDGGNARQVGIWEDQLMHGKDTLITGLAQTHNDGWGPFHFNKGTNMNDALTRVENMSAEDFKNLQDPKYYAQFQSSLRQYSDDGEYNRIMKMVDGKLATGDYEKSKSVHRSLTEDISDNTGSKFLGMGTSYNGKNIVENLEHMSPEDVQKYRTDAAFKSQIDNVVNNMDADEKALAHRLLDGVSKTGEVPQADKDPEVKYLHDKINGADSATLLNDAKAMLSADAGLREKFAGDPSKLSEDEATLRNNIQATISNMYFSAHPQPADGGYGVDDMDAINKVNAITEQLLKSGELSVQSKVDLAFPKEQIIADAAKATDAERAQIRAQLSPQEQQILDAVAKNPNHEFTTADKMRLFALGEGGDAAEFKAELQKLRANGDFSSVQALKDEYAKKYGGDLDNDFLNKVSDSEKRSFTGLLTPSTSDGRQTFYDNMSKLLGEDGSVGDGTGLTMQRAVDQNANMLEEYQRIYKTLPLDQQQALDKYFNDSLEQYKGSKEKLAEIASTALITAASLVAIAATGGAATPLVLAAAFAAGGITKNLVSMGIEGKDFQYTAENIAKNFLSGGVTAAANFVGGEALGFGKSIASVSETVAAQSLARVGAGVVREGAEGILAKSLPEMLARGAGKLTEEDLGALVNSVAAKGATQAERDILRSSIEAAANQQAGTLERLATSSGVNRVIRGAVESGITGGVVNSGTTAIDQVLNGQPINLKEVVASGLTGFAMGSVIHLGFSGVKGAYDAFSVARTPGIKGGEPNLYAAPEAGKVEYVQRGNEVYKVDGSKGEHLKLQDGDVPLRQAPPEGKFAKLPQDDFVHELSSAPEDVERASSRVKVEGAQLEANRPYIIGRGSANNSDIHINNSEVSGRHASIRVDEAGNRYITDLKSTNGTYVNGQRIKPFEEVRLKPTDTVSLGPHQLRLTEQAPEIKMQLGSSNVSLKPGEEIPIGRGKNGVSNSWVSSDHGALGRDQSGYYIVDHSRNGTFITRDGQEIRIPPNQKFYLRPDDQISLGGSASKGYAERVKLSEEAPAETPKPRNDAPQQPVGRDQARDVNREVQIQPVQGGLSPKALEQSNNYGQYHEIKERIEDGWSAAGRGVRFNADGTSNVYSRPVMVVDRAHDPVLRAALDEAKAKFGHLPPRERAAALTKWANEKLKPGNMSESQLDHWYDKFNNDNAGKRIYFGEFLKEGKGVCSQQAILLKLAADEFPDMHATLIRGNFGRGAVGGSADSLNHAWTEFDFGDGPRVHDPRHNFSDGAYDGRAQNHTPGRDVNARQGRPNPLLSGDKVAYQGSNSWSIQRIEGANAVIQAYAEKALTPEAVASLNPNKPLVVGQEYKVRRSDGSIDDGWKLLGRDGNGRPVFGKANSVTRTVPLSQLTRRT